MGAYWQVSGQFPFRAAGQRNLTIKSAHFLTQTVFFVSDCRGVCRRPGSPSTLVRYCPVDGSVQNGNRRFGTGCAGTVVSKCTTYRNRPQHFPILICMFSCFCSAFWLSGPHRWNCVFLDRHFPVTSVRIDLFNLGSGVWAIRGGLCGHRQEIPCEKQTEDQWRCCFFQKWQGNPSFLIFCDIFCIFYDLLVFDRLLIKVQHVDVIEESNK